MGGRRNRKGMTIVMVVLMTTVLMGFAAFAIDISRMYAYQSELQRSADASAHAGAVELLKAGFSNADAVAAAYANANAVEGSNPTVDSIEFGVWNPTDTTFTSLCKAPCAAATAAGATALRVSLSGGPSSPILGQFVGSTPSPTSIKVSAIAWVAPTVAQHDCSKPLAAKYMALTNMLATFEGRAGLDSERVLDSTDLATMRSSGPTLAMCLITNATDQCTPTTPPATTFAGSYKPVQLYPPATEGADPFLTELEEPCASTEALAPTDAIEINPTVNAGDTQTGTDSWCALYNGFPCLMKLALWDTTTVTVGTTATDGNACAVGTCKSIRAIVPFIITNITESGVGGNANAAVQGYPTLGVDESAIAAGGIPGPISRIVLVH
jgi:Flp pilus assembly protein TadG